MNHLFSIKTRILSLLIISCLAHISAEGQNVSWAIGAGNTGSDQGYDISNDSNGNLYVTGWFSGSAQFGSQTLVSAGLQDIFLASYDSSGQLNWVQRAGSAANDVSAGIATNANGDTYITGWFKDTCDFGGGIVISHGSYDMFVAKYDVSGTLQWVQSGGGTLDDYGNRVAISNNGGVTVAGSFKNIFDASGMQMTSKGNRDALISHYDSNGQLLWMRGIGGSSEDRAYGIIQDVNDNYFITGLFSDVVDFDGTMLTCNSFYATYLAKLSSQGNILWAVKGDAGANDFARGFGVLVDLQGNPVTNGFYSGTLNMGGATLAASGGQYDQDSYLIKFTNNGSLLWARTAGGSGTDHGLDLHLTSNNEILAVGFFHDVANFQNTTITATGLSDVYVAKYDGSGNVLSVSGFGGAGNEYAYGVTSDDDGNVYLTGVFTGSSQMGSIPLVSNGGNDILIAKVSLTPLGINTIYGGNGLSMYPNPARDWVRLDFSDVNRENKPFQLEIQDLTGRTVLITNNVSSQVQVNVSDLQSGLYTVRFSSEDSATTAKLIVQH
ncbi:MAG: T9SS type A sorting domain-containing protein [Bacteroidota bacterium]